MPVSVEIVKNIFAKKGAKETAKGSILKTCEKVVAYAKALCPIDFGQLANSISYTTVNKNGGFNDGTVSGTNNKGAGTGDLQAPDNHKLTLIPNNETGYAGTNSDHWYTEFGTRYMAAQPFLRPSKEIAQGAALKRIVKLFGQAAMQKEFRKRKVKTEKKNV